MRRLVLIVLLLASCGGSETPEETARAAPGCEATTPNGSIPPGADGSVANHGNGELWVRLEPSGRVEIPETDVNADGSAEAKLGWFRGVRGELHITGHRLDADAPPLRSTVPKGYPGKGFQMSGIIFPTPGCWEITGRVADASLTFVVELPPPGARAG